MKVKDILKLIKDLDPELEVTTAVSQDCCSDYSVTYGIDPHFCVEKLYEYCEEIILDEDDVKERISDDNDLYDEEKIDEILLSIPVSEKLVITVSP
jgi:hypothetical protein